MAYEMRYRAKVYLIDPQNNGGDVPQGGPVLLDVGSYEAANPTQVVLRSLPDATGAALSVNNRMQSSFDLNVRFEIFGKPVGAPEQGAPDLTGPQKEERRYILGDSPNPALLIALRKANRKPAGQGADKVEFVPVDVEPEVDQNVPNP